MNPEATTVPAASAQLFRYVLVGAAAFLVDVGVLLWLTGAAVHYLAANTAAFLIANLFNFAAAHRYVFRGRQRAADGRRLYLMVLGISLVGLAINDFLMYLGAGLLALPLLPAKVIATVLTLLWNFCARKRLAYY